VFIGIQVSNWNDRAADRRVGQEYLARIQEELTLTQRDFEGNLELANWVVTSTNQALDTLEHSPEKLNKDFLLNAYVAAHELIGRVKRDVYDELLSVGGLSKISDLETRIRIQGFYQIEQEQFDMGITENDYQRVLRRAMPHDVIQMIRDNCSAVFASKNSMAHYRGTAQSCDVELTDEQLSRTLSDLAAAELKPSLREALGDYTNKQSDFMRVLRRVKELRDYLGAAPR
jgi:hypothetical protein